MTGWDPAHNDNVVLMLLLMLRFVVDALVGAAQRVQLLSPPDV
jgi:hypothetical protein